MRVLGYGPQGGGDGRCHNAFGEKWLQSGSTDAKGIAPHAHPSRRYQDFQCPDAVHRGQHDGELSGTRDPAHCSGLSCFAPLGLGFLAAQVGSCRVPFHDFEAFDALELGDVAGDESRIQAAGLGGDEQIQGADGFS